MRSRFFFGPFRGVSQLLDKQDAAVSEFLYAAYSSEGTLLPNAVGTNVLYEERDTKQLQSISTSVLGLIPSADRQNRVSRHVRIDIDG